MYDPIILHEGFFKKKTKALVGVPSYDFFGSCCPGVLRWCKMTGLSSVGLSPPNGLPPEPRINGSDFIVHMIVFFI